MRTLHVEVDIGRGGSGDMFQINSARDVETDETVDFTSEELGRHFSDRLELTEFLSERLQDDVEVTDD